MTDSFADPLEISGKVGTVKNEGDREHETRGDTEDMIHATSAGVVQDPGSVVAAIAQLSLVRKRLGQARKALEGVPDDMITDLARDEAAQEIVASCAWIEEAREMLKKPLDETDEYADGKTWDGKFAPGVNQDPTPRTHPKQIAWAFGTPVQKVVEEPVSEEDAPSIGEDLPTAWED